ncbi:MAG TPA: PKD domain-containing protein, partial [Polyangiaceae bacterium]
MNYKKYSRFGNRAASLMLGAAGVAASVTSGGQAEAARNDIVVRIDGSNSSAVIVVDDTAPVDGAVLDGVVSLDTDAPFCVASPSHPCYYTLNYLRIEYTSFTVNTTDGDYYTNNPHVLMQGPLAVEDHGLGIELPVSYPVEAGADYSDSEGYLTPGWRRPTEYQSAAGNLLLDANFQLAQVNAWFNTSHEGHTGELVINASALNPFSNLPPVANAGADVNITCGGNLTLDASGSTDPNNNIVAYRWLSPDGSRLARISSVAGSSITVPMPAEMAKGGSFDVKLEVVDRYESIGSDTMKVNVSGGKPAFTFVPADVVTSSCGAVAIGKAKATDPCGKDVTITNNAPASFPVGVTLVTWTATSSSGQKSTALQRVQVDL